MAMRMVLPLTVTTMLFQSPFLTTLAASSRLNPNGSLPRLLALSQVVLKPRLAMMARPPATPASS